MGGMNKRSILTLLGLGAAVLIVALNFGYVHQFGSIIRQVHWYVFPLVLAVQALGYWANSKYYQVVFKLLGFDLAIKPLYEIALAINFVNQAFPSGGVSGASFLSHATGEEITAGKATLAQLGRYVFTFLSFLLVLSVGFVLLILGNNVTHFSVRLMLLFLVVMITVSIVVLTLVNERSKLEAVVTAVVGWLNRVWRRLSRSQRILFTHERLKRFFDEFYEGYAFMLEKKGQWHQPFLYCLGANVAEVATVYVVFFAFGFFINPGVVIAGYTLANIFSVVSVFSSGAGLYEATMIGSFAALGVPFAVAFSVVVVYRMLNFALFLPLGFRYYRKYI